MKAPERIYVEVCEDGIFAFPKPPFEESLEYVRADVVEQPASEELEDEIERVCAEIEEKNPQHRGLKPSGIAKIARHFAELGEKNAYKAIMKKADEVRDKRFDTDYEVKIEPSAGFDFGCVNVYREGKLVGQYVEPKEEKKLPEGLDEAAGKSAILTYQMPADGDFEKANKVLEARVFHEIGFKAGAEFSAPRWISVEESLPPFDEEVIVLTNEMHGNTLSSACHLCFGHRPNPEGWTGRSIFTGEVHHLEPNLHDGWNIPGVRYWMPCPKLPEDSL